MVNLKLLKYLYKKGAEINALDNFGCTPLHRAIESDQIEMVEFLLEQGADVELKVGGYIYLDQIAHSNKSIDALLIKYGA